MIDYTGDQFDIRKIKMKDSGLYKVNFDEIIWEKTVRISFPLTL